MIRSVLVENGKRYESAAPVSYGEARCIKRNDLVKVLADALPQGTIRFGCRVASVKLDETTSFPIIRVQDGTNIKAKVLIGCDGANSVVAEFLRLNRTKVCASRAVRGLTSYPNGHGFRHEFVRIKTDDVLCGRLPITAHSVFWFALVPNCSADSKNFKDQEAVQKLTLRSIKELSEEWKEMVKKCDKSSLYMSSLRYRTPWEILFGKFRTGTVTVAGDAMHMMGPFLGQGGSSALEDAVVMARCLAEKIEKCGDSRKRIEEGIDEYVRERRMRLFSLSTQTYLTGLCIESSSRVVKLMFMVFVMVLFFDPIHHTRYDCGRL
ncbi:PREDICTED: uncharacterized protein LOC104821770 isoform X2 [Tarenaya hassleriana]|uniref:uncharacterized protein LOC104821770 isoform X2 n=1 Tax=Tarenaya hassleriana TaxID=28532 RepID=UPI00053C4BCF|nr:PREDICTED: uncharacterized protein LOC104821770 isoform X2 [Tarenaya hassleriana]